MLLRIAPNMFQDKRYGCVTLKEVHDEILGTQKFKSKYPWRTKYKDKLNPLSSSKMNSKEVTTFFTVIDELNKIGTVNKKTNRLFDLSHTDKKILAGALAFNYKITSGDYDLVQFAKQEFSSKFKGSIYPLEIINAWLKKKLIKWDDTKHEYLSDWDLQIEHQQPIKAIGNFQKLTKRRYPGS
jgi:hypothetical protein